MWNNLTEDIEELFQPSAAIDRYDGFAVYQTASAAFRGNPLVTEQYHDGAKRRRGLSKGCVQQGGNYLQPSKIRAIIAGFESGLSVRGVEKRFTVSHSTALKYRKFAQIPNCACGASISHRGWCKARYAQSPKRQMFMRRWHG